MEEPNQKLTPKGYQKKPGRNIGLENVRQEKLYFKVNQQELQEIKKRFQESELEDMSKYLRHAALNLKLVVIKNKEIDTKLRNEVRRIGVNLNQSTHALNSKYGMQLPENLPEQIKELTQLCHKILEKLS